MKKKTISYLDIVKAVEARAEKIAVDLYGENYDDCQYAAAIDDVIGTVIEDVMNRQFDYEETL